jgi:hypothetical protein
VGRVSGLGSGGACLFTTGGAAGCGAGVAAGVVPLELLVLLPLFEAPGFATMAGVTGSVDPERSPNTTCAFAGRRRTAVAQSVGAGWRSAGTPSIQMRHIPGGGR